MSCAGEIGILEVRKHLIIGRMLDFNSFRYLWVEDGSKSLKYKTIPEIDDSDTQFRASGNKQKIRISIGISCKENFRVLRIDVEVGYRQGL